MSVAGLRSRSAWRAALWICVAGALIASVAACGSTVAHKAKAAPLTISMGVASPAVDELLYYIAKNQGFFRANGLDVTLQTLASGVTATDALISGSLQVASAGGTESIKAIAAGAKVRILGASLLAFPYYLVSSPDITRPEELVGKAVAVSQIGSSSYFGVLAALASLHIPLSSVTVEQVGSEGAREDAVKAGSVAASVISVERAGLAESTGLHGLLNMADARIPFLDDALIASSSFLASHKQFLPDLRKALAEARSFLMNPANKSAATRDFAHYYGVPASSSMIQSAWAFAQKTRSDALVFPAGLQVSGAALAATENSLKVHVASSRLFVAGAYKA